MGRSLTFDRGKVHTPYLAAQLRDFSGLRYGKITPTDIDGFMDFGNCLHVFIEAKLSGNVLPRGQELALERLVDNCAVASINAIGIVCEHTNRVGDIKIADCIVTKCRWRGRWQKPRSLITVRVAIDRILHVCQLDHYLYEGNIS